MLQENFQANKDWEKILPIDHPISSIQFSRSVVSDTLRPHGMQHTRPLCPSATPGVGDGQGGLACCDLWGHKESDTTQRLN